MQHNDVLKHDKFQFELKAEYLTLNQNGFIVTVTMHVVNTLLDLYKQT